MKRLLFVIIAAAALWGGYWVVGSMSATRAFTSWFDARQAEGWIAEYDAVKTRGFPSRFDTTISDLSLADPNTGLAYSAPFVQFFALSYKPEHIIVVWPNAQKLSTPFGTAQISSTDMRASLVVQRRASLALERTNFVAADLRAELPDDQVLAASGVTMAIEAVAVTPNTYHFGLETRDVVLPQPAGLRLQTGLLPDQLERARADVTMSFDATWDIDALQTARPQPTQIDIKLIEARWGQLELQIAGSLSVDAKGIPTGQVTIKADNWRDILTLVSASGFVPQQLLRPIEQGLSLVAGLSGRTNSLDLPLDFANGRMLLGPIPIGKAPVLRLR
jgi:hypothetical protein